MELFKAKQNYKIVLGNDSLSYLDLFLKKNHDKYSTVFILVDENTHKVCLPVFLNNLNYFVNYEVLEIPAGENSKVLSIAEQLWMAMSDVKADRNSLLINLGGGVVGDLGGFVASCYKRGIDFIQVPTTLLAMVDASIGGKTGIDIGYIKNLVGTFSAPKMVVVMPVFLETLEEREIKSGFAEIIKHALIADKKLWKSILKLDLKKSNSVYEFLIKRSIEIKNDVVSKDPNEKGLRKILNYGHTVGHALESYFLNTKFAMLHGEAILAGMLIENNISVKKGLLAKKKSEEIHVFFRNNFKLPKLNVNEIDGFVELMKNDKKNNSAIINCALLNDIGSCIEKVACSTDEIKAAFEEYILENK